MGVGPLTRDPLRLGNIYILRFDRHLHRPDPRRDRIAAIQITLAEAKTPHAIDMAVSGELSDLLNAWIRDFWPIIAKPGCLYLPPGEVGPDKPITPQAFREAIKDATREQAGVCLTPNQFRRLAAHRYLAENPGDYDRVGLFLAHASIETTIRYYAGTDQTAAMRRFYEVITKGRRNVGRKQSRRPCRRYGE